MGPGGEEEGGREGNRHVRIQSTYGPVPILRGTRRYALYTVDGGSRTGGRSHTHVHKMVVGACEWIRVGDHTCGVCIHCSGEQVDCWAAGRSSLEHEVSEVIRRRRHRRRCCCCCCCCCRCRRRHRRRRRRRSGEPVLSLSLSLSLFVPLLRSTWLARIEISLPGMRLHSDAPWYARSVATFGPFLSPWRILSTCLFQGKLIPFPFGKLIEEGSIDRW